jgi:hypothetical protein
MLGDNMEEFNIYDMGVAEELLECDEISPAEQGFMQGYEDAGYDDESYYCLEKRYNKKVNYVLTFIL